MANKDSNSSKTAHVMNLLSKSRSSAPAPQAEPAEQTGAIPEAAPVPQAEAAAPKTAPVAPLISSLNADAAVSSQIKDALESELGAELAAEAASAEAPQPVPEPEEVVVVKAPTEPVPSADKLMDVPAAEEPAPTAESVAASVPEEPAPPEAPNLPEDSKPPEEASSPAEDWLFPTYTNVMQILVEEKAEKYMRMFGLCCCDKCQLDVKAYALNHLPPKYVVMAENERVPKLTVYESKYSSDVTAQLIQDYKVVMTHPHHTR